MMKGSLNAKSPQQMSTKKHRDYIQDQANHACNLIITSESGQYEVLPREVQEI